MSEATTAGTIVEGVVESVGDGLVRLARAGTDYVLELAVEGELRAKAGEKVRGEVRVRGARADVIASGGKYIEPVAGRPRRVAGRIVEIDSRANLLVVDAGPFVVVVTPQELQRAKDFRVDQMVTMGVKPGASFKAV